MRLAGKVALVTGAASGIGKAVSRRFTEHGAVVVLADRDTAGLRGTQAELGDADALALPLDIADPGAVDDAVAQVLERYGVLDAVVHAAGIDDPEVKGWFAEFAAAGRQPLVTPRLGDLAWRRLLSVNLDGSFFVIRAALRVMVPRGCGTIVTVASVAGVEGTPGYPHYSAAKGGLLALTRSVAKEVAPLGIRVNAIAPDVIDTPMSARTPPGMLHPHSLPSRRFGRPEEVADAAVFLSSEESGYVVGETLVVSGGRLTV